jgi:hypothetical protein
MVTALTSRIIDTLSETEYKLFRDLKSEFD